LRFLKFAILFNLISLASYDSQSFNIVWSAVGISLFFLTSDLRISHSSITHFFLSAIVFFNASIACSSPSSIHLAFISSIFLSNAFIASLYCLSLCSLNLPNLNAFTSARFSFINVEYCLLVMPSFLFLSLKLRSFSRLLILAKIDSSESGLSLHLADKLALSHHHKSNFALKLSKSITRVS